MLPGALEPCWFFGSLLPPAVVRIQLSSSLCLPREEAKEMWEKREAEWARERSARDRLMSEVIRERAQVAGRVSGVGDHVLTLPNVLGTESPLGIFSGLSISL